MSFYEPRILSAECSEVARHPLISSKTQHCVEQLCADGCESVRLYIRQLEQGENIPHSEELEAKEKQQVLAELRAIMAVYDK